MKNEKLNFVEFGGSRKSQIKADFSGKKGIQFVLRRIGAGGQPRPQGAFPWLWRWGVSTSKPGKSTLGTRLGGGKGVIAFLLPITPHPVRTRE